MRRLAASIAVVCAACTPTPAPPPEPVFIPALRPGPGEPIAVQQVVSLFDASATVVRIYKIDRVRFGARELARIILESTDQVRLAMVALEGRKHVADRAVEINRLENEADRTHQVALGRLFDEERDPIQIIKWKEILDFLEDATDRCEDVANVVESVVVKHA